MHFNIVLLPKKVTNYITWLLFMESNVLLYFYVTLVLLFKSGLGLLVFIHYEEYWICFCAGEMSKCMFTFSQELQ